MAIHKTNLTAVAAVQEKLDQPVTLYALEYGIVGEDEDSGKFVDTRNVVVRTGGDKHNTFMSLEGDPVHYWHPVKAERFTATATGNKGISKVFRLPYPIATDDIAIRYIPGSVSKQGIEADLQASGWRTDFPPMPVRTLTDDDKVNYETSDHWMKIENLVEEEFGSVNINRYFFSNDRADEYWED